jgi:hypothetical protein
MENGAVVLSTQAIASRTEVTEPRLKRMPVVTSNISHQNLSAGITFVACRCLFKPPGFVPSGEMEEAI